MNIYKHKYYGGFYIIASRKGGITLRRFFDSSRSFYCKSVKLFHLDFAKMCPKEARQIIASKYIHKKSGNVYRVRHYAICKDRDVEVVIYTDNEGKYYTREKGEFLKKFELAHKGGKK